MMARSWRDYEPANERAEACDNSDKSDKSPEPASIVPIVASVSDLPADIRAGLERLAKAPAPRSRRADLWPEIVADALGLAAAGWAAQALGLGWGVLDLWGAVSDPAGDPAADGLAVKLEGRRVLALCASFATVADERGGRAYLYRVHNEGARLLWALTCGR